MDPSVFTSIINSYLPEPHASLLNGIIFGVQLSTTKSFYENLKEVGLLHIVVLSGINITMLGAIVGSLTKNIGRSASILITSAIIILFIIFVGPQAPIIRAGFMGIITLVSIVFGRKQIAIYSLLLSAIFVAIFWPQWLSTVSFQLSYGATLGIILFGNANIKRKKGLFSYLRLSFLNELRPSLAAQVFTVPIIFLYFKQISFIAPISNLLVALFIPPLMILGFLTAVLGKINYGLGIIPAYLSYGILSYMIVVIDTLAKIPYVYLNF